jgi:class 3 adenylate cyclase
VGIKDDLESEVAQIYKNQWTRRDGRKVPEDTDVAAGNDAVDLDATILYADLDESTKLVDNYKDWFAAENYKTFLRVATRIIRSEGGFIRSFDGDRVMGVFIGEGKADCAARSGLKINWAVQYLIQPKLKSQYPTTEYVMKHTTGIDSSKVMVTKGGIRNSNDLVWVGRSANHAAKLCALSADYPTWITDKVYDALSDSVKYSADKRNMWEERKWTTQSDRRIYRSNFWWRLT